MKNGLNVLAESAKPVVDQWQQELLIWMQSSREFVTEQAPAVAQEILAWGTVGAFMWIGVAAVLIGVALFLHKWRHSDMYKNQMKESTQDQKDFLKFFSFFPMLGFSLVGSIVILSKTLVLLNIYFAPKLFIVQYLYWMTRSCR